jgi:hypothetical protein
MYYCINRTHRFFDGLWHVTRYDQPAGPQTQNPNLPFDPNQPSGEMINSARTTFGVNNSGFIR